MDREAEINRYKEEAASLKKQLEEKQERLNRSRDRVLQEANQQAAAILKEAKDLADETIRNFHKYGKTHMDASAMEKDREKIRKKMAKAQSKSSIQKKEQINHNVPKKAGKRHPLPSRSAIILTNDKTLRGGEDI